MKPALKWGFPFIAVLMMTACGGSSDSNNTDDSDNTDNTSGENSSGNTTEDTSQFTSSAEWIIAPAASSETCFDFDSNGEVDCSGSEWDIKLAMGSRTPAFYTNSGESGDGSGGTLGSPFAYTWETLQAFASGTEDNEGNALSSYSYVTDSLDNAFANSDNSIGSAVFEYTSTHKLLSNYSVFLVTADNSISYSATDSNVYAVQITGYYGGDTGSTSGYPTLRWVNVAELTNDPDNAVVHETTLNAASGWVYFDLVSGETVADAASSDWQLAFYRYNVKSNSGISGSGTAGSFYAQQPAGFYDAEGAVIESAFSDADIIAAAESALTDTSGWTAWSARTAWATDAAYSVLNPDYQGTYPDLLYYGFYAYDATGATNGTQHILLATPDNGVMLRSGSGNSYARMHLTALTYADSSDSSSQTTWTFNFDVQPAAE
ncbi:HmuY family protein [Thalassolituus sp. LLYu03]|uniref:HmuY family protein n=1 Tax=Thalassolituus sp. LLYu03 TaxID=3421656 RepID=UPI003D2CB7C1